MLKRFFTPKWQHQDPSIREQALEELDASSDVETIVKLVTSDPTDKIKALALKKLTDSASLQSLLNNAQTPVDWCRYAYRFNQLSPKIEALTAAFERVKDGWDKDDTFKVIVSHQDDQPLTNALLLAIDDPESLFKIATSAKSIELRLKAVEDINDLEQLSQLVKKATNKQVLQVVRAKLSEAKLAQKVISETIDNAIHLTDAMEKLSVQSWFDAQFEVKVNHTVESWRKLDLESVESATTQQKNDLRDCVASFQKYLKTCQLIIQEHRIQLEQAAAKQDALDKQNALCLQLESLLSEIQAPSTGSLEAFNSVKEAFEFLNDNWQQTIKESEPNFKVEKNYLKLQSQLESHFTPWESLIKLTTDLEALFARCPNNNYEELSSWLNGWRKLEKQIGWNNKQTMPCNLQGWSESANKLQTQLDKILSTQKKKANYLSQKISLLQKHCQQKNLIAANKLVNYISQKMNESVDDFKAPMQKKLDNILPKLEELRDWHAFATGPKKDELCLSMEKLIDEPMEPLIRAKKVRELQQQWRELLASDPQADDQSWERFKTASDTAYVPCLEYYAEKDKARAENLKKRIAISDSLEQLIVDHGWNADNSQEQHDSNVEMTEASIGNSKQPNWKAIDKTINKVNQEWKKNQPVPENERESLQNHYNAIVSVIREKLDAEKQLNLESRVKLVEKAVAFYQLEDIDKSIQGVINLQKQWKEIGITYYKADRDQWKLFREAIDNVFSKRDSLKKQFKNELQINQRELKELTGQIDQLCKMDDEALKQSYPQFEELKQRWGYGTELPRASAQTLLKAFENSCNQYQQHFAGLPQRIKKSSFNALLTGANLLNSAEEHILQGGSKADDELFLQTLTNKISELKCDEPSLALLKKRLADVSLSKESKENQSGLLQLQDLALSTEILLAIESPESCKQQRMAIQLEQLQKGIGTSLAEVNKAKEVLAMFNTWVTVGFISSNERQKLETRRARIFTAVEL